MTLALVFLCGAAAGALAMNLGFTTGSINPGSIPPPVRPSISSTGERTAPLPPAKPRQIQSILNDFWKYYRNVLSDSKQRVEQLLNEDQRQKFERMLQEHAK